PMEKLESYKKVRMLETMKLDEETGLKLVSRYNKHREVMKGFEKGRAELMDKLDELVRNNANETEYQKVFDNLLEYETKTAEARSQYLNELKEILTNKQIAEYLIFERSFARDIRDIVRDVQRERMKK
ncbi:MAG: hypothetical protein PHP42_01080, partial [Bacteroidota bacterium]|nr:hypothetical protein [Bacteroidota bacterium]